MLTKKKKSSFSSSPQTQMHVFHVKKIKKLLIVISEPRGLSFYSWLDNPMPFQLNIKIIKQKCQLFLIISGDFPAAFCNSNPTFPNTKSATCLVVSHFDVSYFQSHFNPIQ